MNPLIPQPADIVDKHFEAKGIFTFRLRFRDQETRKSFHFLPGQFNMVYLFGVGEVPISIVSDPSDPELLDHTIRAVGNVTGLMARLKKGEVVGLRGPYGSAWPLTEARGKDVILITGGLGCAPAVSVINYIVNRREFFGALKILHGVKTPKDLIYRSRIRQWMRYPNTELFLTVDHPDQKWKYSVGVVTNLFSQIKIDPQKSIAMICGPEIMMHFTVKDLLSHGLQADQIYLSLERNMKCAVGICGHCQFGPAFVCKEGPVFRYDRIRHWFNRREI